MSKPTNGYHSERTPAMIPNEPRKNPALPAPAKKKSNGWFGALLFLTLAAAAAVVVGLWIHGSKTDAPSAVAPSAPPAMPVSVASVLERTVTEWDEFSGRIQAIDHVEIRPRVAGTIDQVHFEEGQLVKKGDPLFTIDPRPFRAELAHAQANQAEAEARLGLAQTALDRSNRLIADHSIAQSELDQSNAELLSAQANLKAAQAAVLTAQLNLEYTLITSPIDGRVSRAEITEGNLVATGPTAPLLTTVVSVSPVYVEFEIDEQTAIRYAANGAVGNSGLQNIPVSMGLSNEEGYPHQGRLKSLDNALDPSSGTLRVRAIFDNSDGALTPGLSARVRTAGSAAEKVILVDDRAIGTDQDKKYVMVLNDATHQVAYRAVDLGPIVDGLRIIRSGLQAGEKIVINGLQRVRPNSVVNPELVSMEANHQAAVAP